MLLKTDWVAIAIATFGVGVVIFLGWSSRNDHPEMKKIIHGLLWLMLVLWVLIAIMLVGYSNG